jgi:hypothetical protein
MHAEDDQKLDYAQADLSTGVELLDKPSLAFHSEIVRIRCPKPKDPITLRDETIAYTEIAIVEDWGYSLNLCGTEPLISAALSYQN